jgi:hypothetical protein
LNDLGNCHKVILGNDSNFREFLEEYYGESFLESLKVATIGENDSQVDFRIDFACQEDKLDHLSAWLWFWAVCSQKLNLNWNWQTEQIMKIME